VSNHFVISIAVTSTPPSWRPRDQRDRVEHLVVEREVVGGDEVDPLLLHEAPVVDADLLRGREQLVGGLLALPVALGRELQLARGADAGEA
jgi:hypothetical protein